MQTFDPKKHPNLCALDEKVRKLLSTSRARKWDTPRREYEICALHPIYWMEQYGFIRPGELELGTEDNNLMGGVVPFQLNPPQLIISDRICKHLVPEKYTRVQMIILKHRKAGISTLIAAFDYWHMRFHDNIGAFAIADLNSHTYNILLMIQTFHEKDTCGQGAKNDRYWPPASVPMTKNKKGFRLSNGSLLEQDSGENSNPGTSGTVNVVHMSENAKWRDPENAETSLLNSVPRRGYAFVVKESTAFGINKYADDCEQALRGMSAWELVFITWLDMLDCCDEVYPEEQIELSAEEKEMMALYPQMNMGHVKFRRRQIDMLGNASKFRQDFPLNPREPFLVSGANFFNTQKVQERIDEVRFYRAWKERGIDNLDTEFRDMLLKVKHHPSGARTALAALEDRCVVPQIVTFNENLGDVSCQHDPEAKLDEGAALMFRGPQKGHKYLLSVDVAEGKQSAEYTSDNSVIEVFDGKTNEQVLEWAGTYDEEMTADYAVMISTVYNKALICPELNNKCGGMVLSMLLDKAPRRIYHREIIKGNQRKREPGWDTKTGVKKDVFGQFRMDFKNWNCTLHSLELLQEMLFFMDKQGKLGAADNKRDDRVAASAVALKVISITSSIRENLEASTAPLPGTYAASPQDQPKIGRQPRAAYAPY